MGALAGACLGLAGLAGLALLWWLATAALLWWDTSAIGAAQLRKAQLQTEISQLQANRDAWAAAGMLGKLDRCGPKKLPCVQVDEHAGAFGEQGDYRLLRGD